MVTKESTGRTLQTPYANEVPPLPDDAFSALKADIKANGQMVPIFVTPDGRILDGHHRYKILGDKVMTQIVEGLLTESEELAFVHRWVNNRRSLSSNQRKELARRQRAIAAALRAEDPKKWTQAKVAAELGLSREVVSKWDVSNGKRTKADIPTPDARVKLTNRDKRLVEAQLESGKTQAQVAANFGVARTTISAVAKQADNVAKAAAEREALAEAAAEAMQGKDCRFLLGELAHVGDQVPSNSIDCIITDPPYPKELLGVFSDLGEFAARVLKPGGSLVCLSGQSYLPEVIARLSAEHLNYHWAAAYLTPGGQAPHQRHRKVNPFWKPLLWYVKGKYDGHCIGDVIHSDVNDNDKNHHHWGQSLSGMTDVVCRFSRKGWHICDPFLGGGTTGAICLATGRKFTGIESVAETLDAAKKRISHHLLEWEPDQSHSRRSPQYAGQSLCRRAS